MSSVPAPTASRRAGPCGDHDPRAGGDGDEHRDHEREPDESSRQYRYESRPGAGLGEQHERRSEQRARGERVEDAVERGIGVTDRVLFARDQTARHRRTAGTDQHDGRWSFP